MARPKKGSVGRIQERVVAVRLTEEEVSFVETFALKHGFTNTRSYRKNLSRSEANLSLAIRALIGAGLHADRIAPDWEHRFDALMANARAEWLLRVNDAWRDAIENIMAVGMEK